MSDELLLSGAFLALTVLLTSICKHMGKADDFNDLALNDKLELMKAAIGIVGAVFVFGSATYPQFPEKTDFFGWPLSYVIAIWVVLPVLVFFAILSWCYRRLRPPVEAPSTPVAVEVTQLAEALRQVAAALDKTVTKTVTPDTTEPPQ